jgi:hypothetical protein
MPLIKASNIHTGGGAALPRPLMRANCGQPRRVWVDERCILTDQMAEGVGVVRVRLSVVGRLRAGGEIARRLPPDHVLLCLGNLHAHRRALTLPAFSKSFDLPLLSVPNELFHVRDLVDPDDVFDPAPVRSNQRAVKRFMGMPDSKVLTLDAENFLHTLGQPSC